jgi:hypothetical protein
MISKPLRIYAIREILKQFSRNWTPGLTFANTIQIQIPLFLPASSQRTHLNSFFNYNFLFKYSGRISEQAD